MLSMHSLVPVAALLDDGIIGHRAIRVHADSQGLLAAPDAVGPAHFQRVLGHMDFRERPARPEILCLPVERVKDKF